MDKRIAALAVCLAVMPTNLLAEELTTSTELSTSFQSKYISDVSGMKLHDSGVYQTEVTVTIEPIGIYVDYWNSYSPNGGWDSDSGDEDDFSAGIARTIGNFNIDVGYSYYDCFDIDGIDGDYHAIYATIEGPELYHVTPFLTIENDWPADGEQVEGGLMYRAGVRFSVSVAEQPIDFEVSVAGHDGAFGTEQELFSSGQAQVSSTWTFGVVSITPNLNYQGKFDKKISFDEDTGENVPEMVEGEDIWGGIQLSVAF